MNRNRAKSWTRIFPLVLILFGANQSIAAAGEAVTDPQFGFSLKVPEGFAIDSRLAHATPDTIHGYSRPDPAGGQVPTIILIDRMRGVIGPERLTMQQMPAGSKGRVFTVHWQGFEVDAFEVPETVQGIAIINYNAQIPLKHEAIELRLTGPAGQQSEIRALLDQTLAGLTGESNWLGTAFPGTSLMPHYGVLLMGIAFVLVAGGGVILWLLHRRTPRGTVAVVAVLIYGVSYGIEPGRIREWVLAAGAIRMLGVLGIIIGIMDLVRHRNKTIVTAGK